MMIHGSVTAVLDCCCVTQSQCHHRVVLSAAILWETAEEIGKTSVVGKYLASLGLSDVQIHPLVSLLHCQQSAVMSLDGYLKYLIIGL